MDGMRGTFTDLASRAARACLPKGARVWLKEQMSLSVLERERRARQHPLAHEPQDWDPPGAPCKLGILKEFYSYHKDYVYACRDLGIGYRLLDIATSDWEKRVESSGCVGFLVWPSSLPLERKRMFDDRLRILSEDMGKVVYPGERETWLYESKLRIRDWLEAHGLPHPRTEVFFEREEARAFVETAPLPLVLKTNTGASASGVHILRKRSTARAMIDRAFGPGITPRGQSRENRQGGVVYLQEYFADVREWRMVRIGRSFFGYRKEKGDGEFHSASKTWSWLDPPRALLDLTREVTDSGKFTSMNVDVFETTEGRLLVNELQTVFGATTPADQLRVNGVAGRYVLEEGAWRFDAGPYSAHACANLRVRYLVEDLLSLRLPESEWEGQCRQ